MKVIGLTGNVASGKTSVARIFGELGAVVINADDVAREAVMPGSPALKELLREFGEEILTPSGSLDRRVVRDLVFRQPEARERLNEIVHPVILDLIREMIDAEQVKGTEMVVIDAPLVYETGIEDWFDLIVVVDAPEEIRMERLVRRKGVPPDVARGMIASQMDPVEKRRRADYVLENNRTREELRRGSIALYEELKGA